MNISSAKTGLNANLFGAGKICDDSHTSSLLTAASPLSHRHSRSGTGITAITNGSTAMLPPAHDDSTAVQTVVGSNRGGWYGQNHLLKGHLRTSSRCSNAGKTGGEACVSVDTLMNTVKALVEHFDSKINELAV